MVEQFLDLQTRAMMANSEAKYAQFLDDIRVSDNPWACLKAVTRGIGHNMTLGYIPHEDLARRKAAGETATLIWICLPTLKTVLSELAPQIARADRKRAIEAGFQLMAKTIAQWNPQERHPNGKPVYLRSLIKKNLRRQLPPVIQTNAD